MNRSKINSPIFWRRWRRAGAVGTVRKYWIKKCKSRANWALGLSINLKGFYF